MFFCYNKFYLIDYIIMVILTILPLVISVAYFTVAERKIMAALQRREGPNVVGLWGLLQPLADGLKLIIKETVIPSRSNTWLFILSPIINFSVSLTGWAVIPFYSNDICFSDIHYSILFLFVISLINVYGLIFASWSSNSKYAFYGGIRVIAQMISYEIVLSVLIIPIIMMAGSLNFLDIIFIQSKSCFFIMPLLPCGILFFIAILAETNRAPFDLAESESEVVGGYNIEYSSITFAFFYLAEYSNIILMSALYILSFFGGWLTILPFTCIYEESLRFSIKIMLVCIGFILARGLLPRYRYDQVILLCWKEFMPFAFGYLILVSSILLAFNSLPLVGKQFINFIFN